MTDKITQNMQEFINTLVPSLRDNLLSEKLCSFTKYNRHFLNDEEFKIASPKKKLLFLIDSFSWNYSTCHRPYWESIYLHILQTKNEADLREYINVNSLVQRTIQL